jgi:fucose permease
MNTRNSPLSLLLIAYASYIVVGMPLATLNITWTYIQPTFEVTLGSLGILLGALTTGYLFASVISGRVVGRLGMGNTLVIGSIIAAGGMLSYVLAPNWPVFLVCSLFFSTGLCLLDTGLNTFVSAHYSAGRLNWMHAAFGVGATVGPLAATFVITRLSQSWRASYLVILVCFLLIMVCLLVTRRGWDSASGEPSTSRETGPSLRETLAVPLVMLLLALSFVYGGAQVSAAQFANSLFIDARSISQETAGFWIGVYWLCFTLGRVLMGFIADRVSIQWLLRTTMIGAVLGAGLLSIKAAPTVGFLGLALIGFSLAPIFPMLIAVTPRQVGARHAANTIGFEIAMLNAGAAVIPGFGSFLFERTRLELIGPFIAAVALAMFLLHEWLILRQTRLALRRKVEP